MRNLQLTSHVRMKEWMLSSQDQREDKMATLITSNQQSTTQLKRQGEVRTPKVKFSETVKSNP